MRKLVYLALDAHVSHCVLGGMDMRGKLLFCDRFRTSDSALIRHVKAGPFNNEVQHLIWMTAR